MSWLAFCHQRISRNCCGEEWSMPRPGISNRESASEEAQARLEHPLIDPSPPPEDAAGPLGEQPLRDSINRRGTRPVAARWRRRNPRRVIPTAQRPHLIRWTEPSAGSRQVQIRIAQAIDGVTVMPKPQITSEPAPPFPAQKLEKPDNSVMRFVLREGPWENRASYGLSRRGAFTSASEVRRPICTAYRTMSLRVRSPSFSEIRAR
jgi:hypothetical protein